jgi:chromosome segregation ATPase
MAGSLAEMKKQYDANETKYKAFTTPYALAKTDLLATMKRAKQEKDKIDEKELETMKQNYEQMEKSKDIMEQQYAAAVTKFLQSEHTYGELLQFYENQFKYYEPIVNKLETENQRLTTEVNAMDTDELDRKIADLETDILAKNFELSKYQDKVYQLEENIRAYQARTGQYQLDAEKLEDLRIKNEATIKQQNKALEEVMKQVGQKALEKASLQHELETNKKLSEEEKQKLQDKILEMRGEMRDVAETLMNMEGRQETIEKLNTKFEETIRKNQKEIENLRESESEKAEQLRVEIIAAKDLQNELDRVNKGLLEYTGKLEDVNMELALTREQAEVARSMMNLISEAANAGWVEVVDASKSIDLTKLPGNLQTLVKYLNSYSAQFKEMTDLVLHEKQEKKQIEEIIRFKEKQLLIDVHLCND